MNVDEILLKKIDMVYIGYQLDSVCKTRWNERDMRDTWYNSARRLERIPAKVGRFFDKAKISKLWKTKCEKDPRDDWYFILSTDGTMFEAHY